MSKLSESMIYLVQGKKGSKGKGMRERFERDMNRIAKEIGIDTEANVTEDIRRRLEEAFIRQTRSTREGGGSIEDSYRRQFQPTAEEIED